MGAFENAAGGSEVKLASRSPVRRTLSRSFISGIALAVASFAATDAMAQCSFTDAGPVSLSGFGKTVVQSQVATASTLQSVISTMNTVFLAQGNAFVGSPSTPTPNQQADGVWVRGIGGQINTQNTANVSYF